MLKSKQGCTLVIDHFNRLWNYLEGGSSNLGRIMSIVDRVRVDCGSNATPVHSTTAGSAKLPGWPIREAEDIGK